MLERRTVIGGFEIQGVLRSGPRGVVYEAMQGSLRRPVALRMLSPDLSRDPDFVERFWKQKWPDHPNIVPVYAAEQCEHGLFVAMQLIRGHTLAELMEAGALDGSTALDVLTQVASALDAAHADALAHGWIRPEAVLVDADGRPWLSDFGLTPGAGTPEAERAAFAALVRKCMGRRSVPRGRWETASALMAAVSARHEQRTAARGGGDRRTRRSRSRPD